MLPTFQKAVESRDVFEQMAESYDAWYDSPKGKCLFAIETACIRLALGPPPLHPWLEVGVGTGRFASALAIDDGLDEAAAPLELAAKRGLRVRQGLAEKLPYPSGHFGAVFMVMTLCFLKDPAQALRECERVLRPDGVAVIAFVPLDSAWGQAYERKASEGQPFYAAAKFNTFKEVEALPGLAGLSVTGSACCLLEGPGEDVLDYAVPCEGCVPGAGFVALRLTRDVRGTGVGT